MSAPLLWPTALLYSYSWAWLTIILRQARNKGWGLDIMPHRKLAAGRHCSLIEGGSLAILVAGFEIDAWWEHKAIPFGLMWGEAWWRLEAKCSH